MERTVARKSSKKIHWTTEDVRRCVEKTDVVVFAKGNETTPRSGFTERALEVTKECVRDVVDTSENKSITAAVREYAGDNQLPLIFIKGRLVANSTAFLKNHRTAALKERITRALQ